jgi:hypothetical protein
MIKYIYANYNNPYKFYNLDYIIFYVITKINRLKYY